MFYNLILAYARARARTEREGEEISLQPFLKISNHAAKNASRPVEERSSWTFKPTYRVIVSISHDTFYPVCYQIYRANRENNIKKGSRGRGIRGKIKERGMKERGRQEGGGREKKIREQS